MSTTQTGKGSTEQTMNEQAVSKSEQKAPTKPDRKRKKEEQEEMNKKNTLLVVKELSSSVVPESSSPALIKAQ